MAAHLQARDGAYNNGSQQLHDTKGLPLMFWLSTKLKRENAEAYCAKLGWKYKMITTGWKSTTRR